MGENQEKTYIHHINQLKVSACVKMNIEEFCKVLYTMCLKDPVKKKNTIIILSITIICILLVRQYGSYSPPKLMNQKNRRVKGYHGIE